MLLHFEMSLKITEIDEQSDKWGRGAPTAGSAEGRRQVVSGAKNLSDLGREGGIHSARGHP